MKILLRKGYDTDTCELDINQIAQANAIYETAGLLRWPGRKSAIKEIRDREYRYDPSTAADEMIAGLLLQVRTERTAKVPRLSKAIAVLADTTE